MVYTEVDCIIFTMINGGCGMSKRFLTLLILVAGFFSSFGRSEIEAADRNLIMMEEAYHMLMAPDFDGNIMSQAEAEEIVEAIIVDIDANYMHYQEDNRQAFYNMVESHIPPNRMGAVYKTMPDYFIEYVDSLNAEKGTSTGPQATNDSKDYSVDVSLIDSIVDFYLLTPTFRHIQMDTKDGEVNFQGNIIDASANYEFFFQELPNQIIKVYSSDGSGVREVTVSTNVVVQGLNANYHYGTDQAFLFHNSQGTLSLAYPDLTGLLNEMDEQVWLEYRMVGNYDGRMRMIDHYDIMNGRPEFDPSREWWDLLARIDAEFNVAHTVNLDGIRAGSYDFTVDPLLAIWYEELFSVEPDLETALQVYDETFIYEIIKGGYSDLEAELANLIRLRAYDFIRRTEDAARYEQYLRSSKVALADRLYYSEKVKQDPILNEIFNQVAISSGMTLQGHDLYLLEQAGSSIRIGLGLYEPFASEYPVFVYDLTTGDIFYEGLAGDQELITTTAIERNHGVDPEPYQPSLSVPSDYQLNQDLVDQIVGIPKL